MKWLSFLFVSMAFNIGVIHGQITFEFSHAADLNNFVATGTAISNAYAWSSASGVGGVPGVIATKDSFASLILQQPQPVSTSPLSASAAFFYQPVAGQPADNAPFAVGFVGSTSDALLQRGLAVYLSVAVIGLPGGQGMALMQDPYPVPAGWPDQRSLSPVFSMTSGWYELGCSWQSVGGGGFSYDFRLRSLGITGGDTSVPVIGYSGVVTNLAFGGLPQAYLALRAPATSGAPFVDRVTLIPEPSALALLAFGGGLLLWQRRRT